MVFSEIGYKMKMKSFKRLIQQLLSVLNRLDAWLPPECVEPDWENTITFRWQKVGFKGILLPLPTPHTFPLKRLAAIDSQMKRLLNNTQQFLLGYPANNVLLSGARGTGKSSLIKALLHEYAQQGLRLIEVDKSDLQTLPELLSILAHRPEKFIVFCDDLSFENGEEGYKALKTALDGGLAKRADNVLVYATSNRRHLMPEYLDENMGEINHRGEVHPKEAIEEKVSLSDRFGLWLSFYPFSQEEYLLAVKSWLSDFELAWNEEVQQAALNWAQMRGNRSGRTAYQFVCDWAGQQQLNNKSILTR